MGKGRTEGPLLLIRGHNTELFEAADALGENNNGSPTTALVSSINSCRIPIGLTVVDAVEGCIN